MNPFFQWIAGLVTAKALARRCPRCGTVQIVPKAREREIVHCRGCGAEIPPKRASG